MNKKAHMILIKAYLLYIIIMNIFIVMKQHIQLLYVRVRVRVRVRVCVCVCVYVYCTSAYIWANHRASQAWNEAWDNSPYWPYFQGSGKRWGR